jgi:hypothetical protein
VTVPVQGAQFVNAQWSDYSGSFQQPSVQQGAYNAEFDLKLMIAPVPFLGMEGAVQQDARHHPSDRSSHERCDQRDDGCNGNCPVQQHHEHSAVSSACPARCDGTAPALTATSTVLDHNTWWQSKSYAAGSVNPTRQNILQYISGTVKNGAEVPSFGVCGFGTWTLLAQDFVGQEQYVITPGSGFDGDANGPQAAFRALMVAGVPIYPDPYCPEGTVYFLNTNYLSLYIHEQGSVCVHWL